MKQTVTEKLNEVLDIEPTPSEVVVKEDVIFEHPDTELVTSSKREEDVICDYHFSRKNYYNLVTKANKAIDGALAVANETDSPRAYEVAAGLIKTASDTTRELVDLQKRVQDIEKADEKKLGPSHVTNNTLFLGSTAELQKFLKNKNNHTEDDKELLNE